MFIDHQAEVRSKKNIAKSNNNVSVDVIEGEGGFEEPAIELEDEPNLQSLIEENLESEDENEEDVKRLRLEDGSDNVGHDNEETQI